jgi:hypothetical protein
MSGRRNRCSSDPACEYGTCERASGPGSQRVRRRRHRAREHVAKPQPGAVRGRYGHTERHAVARSISNAVGRSFERAVAYSFGYAVAYSIGYADGRAVAYSFGYADGRAVAYSIGNRQREPGAVQRRAAAAARPQPPRPGQDAVGAIDAGGSSRGACHGPGRAGQLESSEAGRRPLSCAVGRQRVSASWSGWP